MEFSRQEYWSGLPRPAPGDLPDPGIELTTPMSSALAGRFFTTSATWEPTEGSRWGPSPPAACVTSLRLVGTEASSHGEGGQSGLGWWEMSLTPLCPAQSH